MNHKEKEEEQECGSDSSNNIIGGIGSGRRKFLGCFHVFGAGFCGSILFLLDILQNSSSHRGTSEIILALDLSVCGSVFCSERICGCSVWNDYSTSRETIKIIIRESEGSKIVETVI